MPIGGNVTRGRQRRCGPVDGRLVLVQSPRFTWDANASGGDITIGNSGFTATVGTISSTYTSIRGSVGMSVGRWFFQFWIGGPGGTAWSASSDAVGIANASFPLSGGGNYLGSDNNSVGIFGDGVVFRNAGSVATVNAYAIGGLVSIALDASARLLWIRVNGGYWNGNAAANPATGSAGFDISALTGPLFPAFNSQTNNIVCRSSDVVPGLFPALGYTPLGGG